MLPGQTGSGRPNGDDPSLLTPAQALLALYGALDHAVGTGNADIEATVARYLPGSTGTNAGWYEELLVFLADGTNVDSPERKNASPDLSDALTILQSRNTPEQGAARPPVDSGAVVANGLCTRRAQPSAG